MKRRKQVCGPFEPTTKNISCSTSCPKSTDGSVSALIWLGEDPLLNAIEELHSIRQLQLTVTLGQNALNEDPAVMKKEDWEYSWAVCPSP